MKKILLVTLMLSTLLLSSPVLAQGSEEEESSSEPNYYGLIGLTEETAPSTVAISETDKPAAEQVLNISSRTEFFRTIFNWILSFVGMIAMAMVLMAGYYYITARGEEGQIDKSKKMIISAVLGILVVLASYTIVATVLGLGAESGNPFTDFFKSFF